MDYQTLVTRCRDEEDTYLVSMSFIFGQLHAISQMRRILTENGVKTGPLDAALDDYESYLYCDIAHTQGG